MQMSPYLSFNGECEAAFKFYEQCLGGTIEAMLTHGETPACEHAPAEWQDKITHAQLRVGDTLLMGSDSPPQYQEEAGGFSVLLSMDDPAQAERVFHALAESGTVRMPIEETFWAARFGMVTDRFGIPWMINCDKAA